MERNTLATNRFGEVSWIDCRGGDTNNLVHGLCERQPQARNNDDDDDDDDDDGESSKKLVLCWTRLHVVTHKQAICKRQQRQQLWNSKRSAEVNRASRVCKAVSKQTRTHARSQRDDVATGIGASIGLQGRLTEAKLCLFSLYLLLARLALSLLGIFPGGRALGVLHEYSRGTGGTRGVSG